MTPERQQAFDDVLGAARQIIEQGADPSVMYEPLDEYAVIKLREDYQALVGTQQVSQNADEPQA